MNVLENIYHCQDTFSVSYVTNAKYINISINQNHFNTPGRRQSKTLLTIDEPGSKLARNSVFDCNLSPVGRQVAVENSVSNDF